MLTARGHQCNRQQRDHRLGHHQELGALAERQGVGRRERRRVGEGQEEIVDEAGQPVADFAIGQRHLREQEVGMRAFDQAAGRRPAAVGAPEPQREDDDVGDPDV
nr:MULTISPECIES: hypothetical protein [unclassified Mesorhizobium]